MTGKKKKNVLSKSTFIKGLQCRKALYLYKNRYFLRDPLSPEQRAKFVRGTHVGIFARELFPGGVDASPVTHFQMAKSVEKTRELIEEGLTDVIYEAAFSFNDVVVALDILYRENGKWMGVEVKSSQAISETYHWDAALQYYVINGSGLELDDFFIAYIDRDFVREGEIDPWKLFKLESRLEDVKLKSNHVADLISELKQTIALKSSPDVPIGTHCNDPYPCDFIGHCWKKVPPGSIFLLDGIDEGRLFEWYNKNGIKTIDELPESVLLKPEFKNQLESIRNHKPVVDRASLAGYLSDNKKKQLILATFTFSPAIPLFNGTKPYDILPFGLGWTDLQTMKSGIRIIDPERNSDTETGELLLKEAESFDIIWVFNDTLEKAVIDLYARNMPEKKEVLLALKSKFVDLRQPWDEHFVVFPTMKKLKNPEDILTHFDREFEKLPKNLEIPQEVDALYQKLILIDNEKEKQEGLASLEIYIQSRLKNLANLQKLWLEFIQG
ncbi:MAG: DUF2779 domain-containing protein [Bacteroidales bacterium]|nr:DUF2779 domain-containing protein [Bacteroidales bacterium]